ncbi:hypothetical protein IAT38_008462 [Cryptococcus sp. DSM 104549]
MERSPASLSLHRIRFYDHSPSPITALNFAPAPLPPPANPATANHFAKGKSAAQPSLRFSKEEFGVLVAARENGQVEIWEYAKDEEGNMSGNWVLDKTLPSILTHPTISNMTLVIRDPLNYQRKGYSVPKVEDLRLFTAGSDSGDLIERCLLTGRILQTYAIPSPPLWSLSVSPTHDLLCLATTSPNLHFLSIPPPTLFDLSPALSPPPSHLLRSDALPSRTRTVSIAWGVPSLHQIGSSDDWEWRNTSLVTGNSDSSWRKWEIPAPQDGSRQGGNRVLLKSRAVVEKVQKAGRGGKKATGAAGGQKATIVWGVGILPDNTVVTSDSLGNVTFWDAASMSQKQNFRAHKADGMCMTIGPGGRSIYTSGPDQRVCQFTHVASSNSASQWVLTASKRIHSHDVRALAIFPPYLPHPASLSPPPLNPSYVPTLASGGWDMSLGLTSAGSPDMVSDKARSPLGKPRSAGGKTTFEESWTRRMGYLSGGRGNDVVSLAREARLVLGRKERSVGLWRVLDEEKGWEKLLEMELRLRTNIVASAISSNGKWLAVSDLYETKLFSLSPSANTSSYRPTRVRTFVDTLASSPILSHLSLESSGCGSSSLLFTPDSQRLVLGLVDSSQVVIVELPSVDEGEKNIEVEVVKCFERREKVIGGRVIAGKDNANGHAANGGDVVMEDGSEDEESEDDEVAQLGKKDEKTPWVSSLAASEDGQWLGVADLAGRVSVFNLDTLQLHATLPTLPQPPVSISFPPSAPLLALTLPTNNISFYHLEHRRLVPSTPQLTQLNSALTSLHTPVHGAVFEPRTSAASSAASKVTKALVWGNDWLVTVNFDLEAVVRRRRGSESPSVSVSLDGSSSTGLTRAMRKKRAREAREARENLSSATPSVIEAEHGASSSTAVGLNGGARTEDFYKIVKDRFKSVLGVGWLGEEGGEVGVVERPWGDFAGELPGAFWSGGFGRS